MLKEILESKSFRGEEFELKGDVSGKIAGLGLDMFLDKHEMNPSVAPGEGFSFRINDDIYVFDERSKTLYELDIKKEQDKYIINAKKIKL